MANGAEGAVSITVDAFTRLADGRAPGPDSYCDRVAGSSPQHHRAGQPTGMPWSYKLGLAGLDPHALRHTALTWTADRVVPLHMLQRVSGHTQIRQ